MEASDLQEIKALLVEYYNKKVQAEVDAFWNVKGHTTESWNEATRDKHLRHMKANS